MVSYADAAHLLRRAGFGGSSEEINALTPLSRADMVEAVLDVSGAPAASRPGFIDSPVLEEWNKGFQMSLWWLERMRTSPAPLQEKMALFWHGHFATSMEKVYDARVMFDQNHAFRTLGLGGFNALARGVALQAALLRYLDNEVNRAGAPNENFARELLELFLLGVDQHYTQTDIAEGARAWTGHSVDLMNQRTYFFYPFFHDNADKTIFGLTRNWDGPEIIDHITSQEPHKTACARHIARKLWEFFAYSAPEPDVLDAIATAFHDADLDVTALLRAIFNHDAFYSDKARTGHFRSPVEWVVACLKVANITAQDASPPWFMQDMGQQLLNPPNVAGWKTNGVFITTTADWARMTFARYLTWKWYQSWHALAPENQPWNDTKAMTVNSAIAAVYRRMRIDQPSTTTKARLVDWLRSQRSASKAPRWEWKEWQVLNLFTLMLITPDFNEA